MIFDIQKRFIKIFDFENFYVHINIQLEELHGNNGENREMQRKENNQQKIIERGYKDYIRYLSLFNLNHLDYSNSQEFSL